MVAVLCGSMEEFEEYAAKHPLQKALPVFSMLAAQSQSWSGIALHGSYHQLQGWTLMRDYIEGQVRQAPPQVPESTLMARGKKLLDLICLGPGPSPCRGCGRMVWMVRHKNGKAAPYTAELLNHFADCEARKEFKKK